MAMPTPLLCLALPLQGCVTCIASPKGWTCCLMRFASLMPGPTLSMSAAACERIFGYTCEEGSACE